MKTLATVAALALAAASAPQDASVLRTRGWKHVGRAPSHMKKSFSVAMPMGDFAGLERELYTISDPRSPRYGQWLSKEQADSYARTPAHVAKEVRQWAESTGAACKRLPESLRCAGSVAQVEALLSTELSVFAHPATGRKIVRTSARATVPAELEGKVLFLSGLQNFPHPRMGSARPAAVVRAINDADYSVVPETLARFYNTSSAKGASASTQAAVEFQAYPAFVQTDLDTFAQQSATSDYTIPASNIIGAFSPDAQAESTLDVQYLGALGAGNTNWYWTVADWMYEFAQSLSTQPDNALPSVLSMSYAWYELDQCDISPSVQPCSGVGVAAGSRVFVTAVNQMFAKAGARGVTLLAASGDSGAHGRTDPGCTDPATRADFPSSSPYVLSVGATEIAGGQTSSDFAAPICTSGTLSCASGGSEIVASNKVLAFFSSGGGFSHIAPRPSYQDAVVSQYLKNASALPPAGDYNATGRAAPDVAALGHNYYIELGGAVSAVDGTSAATPVMAGMVANLNAWRLGNGKPVLGFVNPLIYAAYAADASAFNDIVQGDNTCTEDACPCPANTGYYAAPGYDATTGLGTINFGKLQAVMSAMGL